MPLPYFFHRRVPVPLFPAVLVLRLTPPEKRPLSQPNSPVFRFYPPTSTQPGGVLLRIEKY